MKPTLRKFLLSSLFICSFAAFMLVNFGEQLPVAFHKMETAGDSAKAHVVLPDVAIFKNIWETSKDLVPRLILMLE